jgi:glycosyltransferase involved in cell wall biosynthesis
MAKPTIICLTPVKNEAWILDRFLQCASLWADHIIIADQNSTDGSQEIARRYPKVTLIENSSEAYHESSRQKLLIDAARKIPGPRLLVALDADEMLTANVLEHPEWNTVLTSPPGTIIEFSWLNLLPGFTDYVSLPNWYYPLGFMDDGSEHTGNNIHSPRIPEPVTSPRIRLQSISILHYQYVNWERTESKQRWYQCWETINNPSKSNVEIYRMYHYMDGFPKNEIHSFLIEHLSGYEKRGIDMTSLYRESLSWRDREIIEWLFKYGTKKFKKLDIWDVNWSEISHHFSLMDGDYSDPRSWLDKFIHFYLSKTQPHKRKLFIRAIDKLLYLTGW